jgi:hypothetical protein
VAVGERPPVRLELVREDEHVLLAADADRVRRLRRVQIDPLPLAARAQREEEEETAEARSRRRPSFHHSYLLLLFDLINSPCSFFIRAPKG